jgi:Fe-S-cluster containining protein
VTSVANICSVQCGAKCCRAPGQVIVSRQEATKLKALASQLKVKLVLLSAPILGHRLSLDFDKNGGKCPFLSRENLCRIYEDRPEGCRNFPDRPTMGCLLNPGNDPMYRVEARSMI